MDDGEEAGASDSDSVLAGPSLTSSDLLSLPEELDNIPFEELDLALPLEELSLPDDEPEEIVITNYANDILKNGYTNFLRNELSTFCFAE